MEAIWNYNTIVDRKRWGIGNTIASSPYAHGEHPERWRANGTFPFPMKAPESSVLNLNNTLTMHLKGEDRDYDNKYAQQLQADYGSLIDNIKMQARSATICAQGCARWMHMQTSLLNFRAEFGTRSMLNHR
ncbi:unnamed protein product [Durusdinium trenchii]|uniref:Uncharacterized protein n=2 Tax=Durusdinium trenchii TaxID=1381693 RepID=A0ABP0Q4K8_9DINO